MSPSPQQHADAERRSRLEQALLRARAGGAEAVSVAFPPLPAAAFAELALAAANLGALRFFLENEKENVAVAAADFGEPPAFSSREGLAAFGKIPPRERVRVFSDGSEADEESAPPPKIFVVGRFEKNGLARAEIPRWQISRRGNAMRICAHLSREGLADAAAAAGTLLREHEALTRAAEGGKKAFPPLPAVSAGTEVGAGRHLEAAARAVAEIRAGRFEKIVLARAKDFFFDGENFPEGTFLNILRERFGKSGCSVFCACADAGKTGEKIFGASPEKLLSLCAGTLKTEAIAGTLAAGKNAADDEALAARLLADPKELREHRLVADFIAEKLRALGVPADVPAAPRILRLPNVLHLRTPFEARVPAGLNLGAAEIADALHPTPAMCGLPAAEAEKFIREAEPFPRENFSAPIGFFDASGDGFFAVAIRCAKVFPAERKIRLYAGSGLVADCVPAKESAEIDAKFSAIESALRGNAQASSGSSDVGSAAMR